MGSHGSRVPDERFTFHEGGVAVTMGEARMTGATARAAIIGGGIAGLAAASELKARGCIVRVFDKGRAAGGRLSTRRADAYAFDHGAPYFTARDPVFRARLAHWEAQGTVQPWHARFARLDGRGLRHDLPSDRRYVGNGGISALPRRLAHGLDVVTTTRIDRIMREGRVWRLVDEHGLDHGVFDLLIVATPAPQAVPLLADVPRLQRAAEAARYAPCWALMIGLAECTDWGIDAARIKEGPIALVARDEEKPGRETPPSITVHASIEWSEAHLESQSDKVADALLSALEARFGALPARPEYLAAHRWRYALLTHATETLFDTDARIGICGDWTAGSRVEDAYLSGLYVAAQVLEHV